MSKYILKSALIGALLSATSVAVPAQAALVVVEACTLNLTSPNAADCAGYYTGNLLSGNKSDIASQKEAIASLDGDFLFDGNWAAVEPSKITSLSNVNELDFGKTLFGSTIIGAHFGNVEGPAGNTSVFWLFDFGSEGRSSVALNNIQGFSNAVLYTTGAVPEPSTWMLMLLGMAGVGFTMRRKDKQTLRVRYT